MLNPYMMSVQRLEDRPGIIILDCGVYTAYLPLDGFDKARDFVKQMGINFQVKTDGFYKRVESFMQSGKYGREAWPICE